MWNGWGLGVNWGNYSEELRFLLYTILNFPFYNFQIMLSDASRTLSTALGGRAYYKQVTVVVPASWRDLKCNLEINTPRSGKSYGVSTLLEECTQL